MRENIVGKNSEEMKDLIDCMRLAPNEKEFLLFFEEFKNKYKTTKPGLYFISHYGPTSAHKYAILVLPYSFGR